MQPYRACKRRQPTPECDSAIGQHLLGNDQRAAEYDEDQFSILDMARSPFHHSLLEVSSLEYGDLVYANRKSLCVLKIGR